MWPGGPFYQTTVEGVQEMVHSKQATQQQLKEALNRAQAKMKSFADKKRIERHFQVDDWVCLKLKPYRQHSLHSKKASKLSPKYVSLFQVLAKVGELAYKLCLPSEAKLHPMFHVSLLKKKIGPVSVVSSILPEFDDDGKLLLQLVQI